MSTANDLTFKKILMSSAGKKRQRYLTTISKGGS